MVVHQDQRGRGQFQRALDHLARIDRGVIDGAGLLHLVGDELVALVEEQQAKLLLLGERHAGAAIVDHLVPGRQRVTAVDPALGDAMRRRREQLELVDRGFANAVHLAQARHRCMHDLGKRAKNLDQRLRQRLGVTPRQRRKQRHLQQLVVAERVCSGAVEALAQPFAMAEIVRRFFGLALVVVGLGGHRPPALPRAIVFATVNCGGKSASRQPANANVSRRDHPICFSPCRSDSVKISTPVAVTPTECSNCADSERSRVTAVQPSERIFTCGLPRLIIGSIVKNMPGLSCTPSPGRPIWMMFGSSWNMRPRPWPQKSRTTLMACGSTKLWMAWPMSPVVAPGFTAAMPRIIAS